MNSLMARWIFCTGLCLLTACAVLPEPSAPVVEAPAAVPSITLEKKLARVMRERAELAVRYGPQHPAMIEAAAAETVLRNAALAADPEHFRRGLIRALGNELADALRDRSEAAIRYGALHPEMRRAESVVTALTAAVNAEVRSAG
jgi:uncharacterized protein involved in exopolysaccharide biosynthesis